MKKMRLLIIILILSICLCNNNKYAKKIKNYLSNLGFTKAGIAGIMGNLYALSKLNPNYSDKIKRIKTGLSEEEYVKLANNGQYSNKKFVKDQIGFGIAAWVRWNRKQSLLNACKGHIGDPYCQVDYLISELKNEYKSLYQTLTSSTDVSLCCQQFLLEYVNPTNYYAEVTDRRNDCFTFYYY